MADENQSPEQKAPTYTREDLAASKKYKAYRDVIMCTLESGKYYTEDVAKTEIDKFLKQEVKEKINERK